MTLESETYRLAEEMYRGAIDNKGLQRQCRLLAQQFQVPAEKVHRDVQAQYYQHFMRVQS